MLCKERVHIRVGNTGVCDGQDLSPVFWKDSDLLSEKTEQPVAGLLSPHGRSDSEKRHDRCRFIEGAAVTHSLKCHKSHLCSSCNDNCRRVFPSWPQKRIFDIQISLTSFLYTRVSRSWIQRYYAIKEKRILSIINNPVPKVNNSVLQSLYHVLSCTVRLLSCT